MAKDKSYSEKLKDPRWQKKRLKILERDNFTCQSCRNEDNTLHVHHIDYFNTDFNKPWLTPDNDLITLCDTCHKTWHIIYDNCSSDYVQFVVTLFIKCENERILNFLNKHGKKIH